LKKNGRVSCPHSIRSNGWYKKRIVYGGALTGVEVRLPPSSVKRTLLFAVFRISFVIGLFLLILNVMLVTAFIRRKDRKDNLIKTNKHEKYFNFFSQRLIIRAYLFFR